MSEVANSSNIKFLDALDRAWRTFYGAVGADLLLALALGLQQLMAEGDPFTLAFWAGVGILLVKSLITAVISFMLRYAKDPKVPTADPPVALNE